MVERVFFVLQYLSPANLFFGTRKKAHDEGLDDERMRLVTVKRGRRIDYYVLGWFLVLTFCAFLEANFREPLGLWLAFLPSLRVFDIMQAGVNLTVFDHLRTSRKNSVLSVTRTLVLGLWNFVELIFCFGIVYSAVLPKIQHATEWCDAYYFSTVTQLTVGYGDLLPLGTLRMVSAIQGILGVVYVVLMLSRFVSLMPRIESVQPSERRGA